ncbi:MAG: hypothetical protein MJZ41_14720 [Bacteroidaceae bacterium]|nr:hypothetical protein [Bacteroidaceae bacterium]
MPVKPSGYGQVTVVALLLWSLEYRNDPGEAGVDAPVRHVASICPHLIEARAEKSVKLHVAVGGAEGVDGPLGGLQYVAARIEELHIQNLAEVCGLLPVGAGDIGLEPHRLVLEVSSVVKMEVNLLLGHGIVEVHHILDVSQYARAV